MRNEAKKTDKPGDLGLRNLEAKMEARKDSLEIKERRLKRACNLFLVVGVVAAMLAVGSILSITGFITVPLLAHYAVGGLFGAIGCLALFGAANATRVAASANYEKALKRHQERIAEAKEVIDDTIKKINSL